MSQEETKCSGDSQRLVDPDGHGAGGEAARLPGSAPQGGQGQQLAQDTSWPRYTASQGQQLAQVNSELRSTANQPASLTNGPFLCTVLSEK